MRLRTFWGNACSMSSAKKRIVPDVILSRANIATIYIDIRYVQTIRPRFQNIYKSFLPFIRLVLPALEPPRMAVNLPEEIRPDTPAILVTIILSKETIWFSIVQFYLVVVPVTILTPSKVIDTFKFDAGERDSTFTGIAQSSSEVSIAL